MGELLSKHCQKNRCFSPFIGRPFYWALVSWTKNQQTQKRILLLRSRSWAKNGLPKATVVASRLLLPVFLGGCPRCRQLQVRFVGFGSKNRQHYNSSSNPGALPPTAPSSPPSTTFPPLGTRTARRRRPGCPSGSGRGVSRFRTK